MLIRKTPTTPIDRPFPDENTVAEMYCNEAYSVDNEAVENWTSSLHMLLTFAAIFSAVLITLIVDSKRLLEPDKAEVLVDAVVFLMNNLANGTYRPYTPPPFQTSAQSIAVNCLLFGSLCLSIATALAAVVAMQWVTDYGAVTKRVGSTPEERLKRRHFRYEGRLDWNMDTIIGALPIALHISVLLFFVGLIVWMWDVHRSVFGVVLVCGALATLLYVLTTALAILCPSCPYRTPLASWVYVIFHLLVKKLSSSVRPTERKPGFEGKLEEGASMDGSESLFSRKSSMFRRFIHSDRSRFAEPSLDSRDNIHIRRLDQILMGRSLIWLSNHIAISPEVSKRLLVLINGISSAIDHLKEQWMRTRENAKEEVELRQMMVMMKANIAWKEIFHALGSVYQSFIEDPADSESEFIEFARQTRCLSQGEQFLDHGGLRWILDDISGNEEAVRVGNTNFPILLLRVWMRSLSLYTSDKSRNEQLSKEVDMRKVMSQIFGPEGVLQTWYELLNDKSNDFQIRVEDGEVEGHEAKDHEAMMGQRLLDQLMDKLHGENVEKRLEATLYLVSTGNPPWEPRVQFDNGRITCPSTSLVRRLRAIDWVDSLPEHPQKDAILKSLSRVTMWNSPRVLLIDNELTGEEEAELKQMGLMDLARWTQPEEMLYSALVTFDEVIAGTDDPRLRHKREAWMVTILCEDLVHSGISFDIKYFGDRRVQQLQNLSNPILRLVAVATFGIEWTNEWIPRLLESTGFKWRSTRESVSRLFFNYPPFFGNCPTLWQLRLRLWNDFEPSITHIYLYNIMRDLNSLKSALQEIQSSQLGIDHAGDFFLALFHLHYPHEWERFDFFNSREPFASFIPIILTETPPWPDIHRLPNDVTQYLSSVCEEINADTARLLRLLIELFRADTNYDSPYRQLQNLFHLLKYVRSRLSGKKLRPFSPSCRRLTLCIKELYDRFEFEGDWDEILRKGDIDVDPQRNYRIFDKEELKTLYGEVITLLEPTDNWDGDSQDISWPRYLLRSLENENKSLEDNTEEMIHGEVDHDQRQREEEQRAYHETRGDGAISIAIDEPVE